MGTEGEAGTEGTQQGEAEGEVQQGESQGQQTSTGFTPEAQAILSKANAEAEKFRKDLAAAKKKLDAYEAANLSETEKTAKRLKELEEQVQTKDRELMAVRTQATVGTVAARLNFVNPNLAHRLIDPSAITYDESGKALNVEALLKDLVKSDPYLVSRRSSDAGAGTGQTNNGGQTMNDLLRQAAGRA